MKNKTDFYADMVSIIAFSILVTIGSSVIAEAYASTDLTWTPPTHREKGSDGKSAALTSSEIAGYVIHYGRSEGSYTSRLIINDGATTAHTFNDLDAGVNYFVITTTDTGGRESKQSAVVSKLEEDGTIKKKPATIDLTVVRVSETFDYVLTFPPVTAWEDGDPLPDGALNKYYYFNSASITTSNPKGWVRNVLPSDVPFTATLTKGLNKITFETEVKVNGANIVSNRSELYEIDVQDFVTPIIETEPPKSPIFIDIPEGAKTVEINFN